MKITQQPYYLRMLFATGLLLTILPVALKSYINLPDFVRGSITGLGIGIEIMVLTLSKRR